MQISRQNLIDIWDTFMTLIVIIQAIVSAYSLVQLEEVLRIDFVALVFKHIIRNIILMTIDTISSRQTTPRPISSPIAEQS